MADDAPKVLGGTAIRPKERHGWEAIKFLLYNPETGEVLTRTPKSWALITVFYIIYYSCLAAFWAAMLTVFMTTLEDNKPKWLTGDSLIGRSPGLGLRPEQSAEFVDSSMIVFDPTEEASWKGWSERSKKFLDKYENAVAGDSKKFDLRNLGPCGQGHYGYDQGKPCIFLKLNKIYGLQHDFYNETAGLPEDMPEGLKTHIGTKSGSPQANQVWVDCQAKNPADKDGLDNINYYPADRGFPEEFFPFEGQPGYLSPLVAVQFEPNTPGQLIHIECRAWAKNIGYSRRDKIGISSLEIMRLK